MVEYSGLVLTYLDILLNPTWPLGGLTTKLVGLTLCCGNSTISYVSGGTRSQALGGTSMPHCAYATGLSSQHFAFYFVHRAPRPRARDNTWTCLVLHHTGAAAHRTTCLFAAQHTAPRLLQVLVRDICTNNGRTSRDALLRAIVVNTSITGFCWPRTHGGWTPLPG